MTHELRPPSAPRVHALPQDGAPYGKRGEAKDFRAATRILRGRSPPLEFHRISNESERVCERRAEKPADIPNTDTRRECDHLNWKERMADQVGTHFPTPKTTMSRPNPASAPEPDSDIHANLARLIVEAAELHCENTGEDHLAGDAQDVFQSLLELLSSEQLSAFARKFTDEEAGTLNLLYQDSRDLARLIRAILSPPT